MLQSIPIRSIVKRHVSACDQLPARISRPAAIIVNTDPSNRPGEHWNAIFIDAAGHGEYFDSFGRAPSGYHLKFIQQNSKSWIYNSKILQDFSSDVCGMYCLIYLYFRMNNVPMMDFVNMFTCNLVCNDNYVKTLYTQYFTMINLINVV